MKFVRFEYENSVHFGVMAENGRMEIYGGNMYAECAATGHYVELSEIRLMVPSASPTMIALWNNSKQQIVKLNRETPREVLWFLKPVSSFIPHGADIVYLKGKCERVVLEGELGIVIGRPARILKSARQQIISLVIPS